MSKPELRFISSWDDGSIEDLKIAEMLRAYKLCGVFFIPNVCGLPEDFIRQLGNEFEVGGHTVNHPKDLKMLNDLDLFSEIADNKVWLEEIVGKEITKFCYPRGRYDDRVIGAVKDVGYKYARTTIVLKTEARDPYRVDTSVHVYKARKEYDYRNWDWLAVGKEYAEKASKEGGIFHIWGHGREIDRLEEWINLDKFFKYLTEKYEIINLC